MHPSLAPHVGKLTIVTILGDAEAWFFDWATLPEAARADLLAHHLPAVRDRMAATKPDWLAKMQPVALLGESMPPPIRGRVDLSAPHSGVLLFAPEHEAVVYAPGGDDDRLILFADLEMLSPRDAIEATLDPAAAAFAYEVDRSESEGFTVGEIEMIMSMAGAELTLL
ncbi:MAG: hypothetical protein IPL61_27040 [Myxococcales bacterium]|nr:hypothetical protein [Myxococcales bacterium]